MTNDNATTYKGKREQVGEKLFYFTFVLWLGSEVLLNSTIEYIFYWKRTDVNDVMAYVVLALLLIQIIFFQKYQIRELAIILLMTIPIAIATINSNHNTMMSTWIFIVAAKSIDFDKVVKIAYVVQFLMILFVFYLFFSGTITEYTMYRGDILRHSYGFSHPNQLGIRAFQLMICRCYVRKDRIRFLDVVIVFAVAQWIKRITNSKTSYYVLIFLSVILLINLIIPMITPKREIIADGAIFISIASNMISLFLSFIELRRSSFWGKLDKFMSSRFSQCHRTLKYYGLSLMGKDIQKIVKRRAYGSFYHFWLDNAYMSILLRYGVIVFSIFSVLYISTLLYLKKSKQFFLMEILCLFAIYGIMENNFFSMSQNIFLLVLAYPIYKRNVPEEATVKPLAKLVWR